MSAAKRILLGRYLRPALLAVDCLIFNLFFWVTLQIYPDFSAEGIPMGMMWLFVNLSLIPVIIFAGQYRNQVDRAILMDRVLFICLVAIGVHALFFLSLISLFDEPGFDTSFYLTYYGMLIVVETLWSLLSRWLIKAYRRKGYNYLRVVIVGTNSTSRRLYEEMLVDPGYGYRVLAFFDNNPREDSFAGTDCHDLAELPKFVHDNEVDQIYYALPGNDDSMISVVKTADDNVAEFFYVPMISQYLARNFNGEYIGSVPVMAIRNNPLKIGLNRFVKRGFDIVFASLFLIVYPLVYIPVAVAIKMSSPGPVYFRQQRTGYKGKPFMCLKFRSMAVNSEADTLQATPDDSRITRLGDFLRRSSIDELPQFINVLKGDMSVVGPRPHMLKHTEEYSKLVDRYMVRHMIKPGITGWAQVNGYRGQTDELWKMEKRVESDVWYIEHWSFLLDLKIIVRTILNAFKHDENAF